MLRSIGIPARWVKGYAPGTEETNIDSGIHIMQVRAKDAHSWVEVYFPKKGWIPFDPTPGFTGTMSFSQEEAANSKISFTSTPAVQQDWLEQWKEQMLAFVSSGINNLQPIKSVLGGFSKFSFKIVGMEIGVLALLTVFAVFCYKRGKSPFYLTRQPERFMERLWLRIFRTLGNKPEHLTLREYIEALQIVDEKQKHTLLALAHQYEAVRYQPQQRRFTQTEMASMWKGVHTCSVKTRSR
jgi:hypothetical protein